MTVRRVAIAAAGFSVLVLGLALLVVPVPGTSFAVLPIGLTILGKEFAWARRLLSWSTGALRRMWATLRRMFSRSPGRPPAALTPIPCP